MTNVADDLMAYTSTLNLAGMKDTFSRSIFAGLEPAQAVDPCIVFKAYGNGPHGKIMEQVTPALTTPRVQVTVRSRNQFGVIQDIAEDLYNRLFQRNAYINGVFYTMIEPMNEPQPFGPDPNGREQIGFLVQTRRRN